MIPEEYKKVLKNIRKLEDRKKKKSEVDNQSNSDFKNVIIYKFLKFFRHFVIYFSVKEEMNSKI